MHGTFQPTSRPEVEPSCEAQTREQLFVCQIMCVRLYFDRVRRCRGWSRRGYHNSGLRSQHIKFTPHKRCAGGNSLTQGAHDCRTKIYSLRGGLLYWIGVEHRATPSVLRGAGLRDTTYVPRMTPFPGRGGGSLQRGHGDEHGRSNRIVGTAFESTKPT